MARTINGKPFQQVLSELRKPFPEERIEYNNSGQPYFSFVVFQERMDEVVGVFNYDIQVSPPEITVVGTRPQILLKVSLTIKDDDGNPVVIKESSGGYQVIVANATGEPVSVKNDAESAVHDGFKRCCKKLGMGKHSAKSRGNDSLNETGDSPTELFRVTIMEKFRQIGKGYAAKVALENGETRQLVIWENAQKKIEEHIPMEKFLKSYVAGKTFSLYGSHNVFSSRNGDIEQIVMKAPYCGNGE